MEPHATPPAPPAANRAGGDRPAEDPDDAVTPVLSVVIVTYNEADRIAGCIESVLAACREGPPFEVVLVDSNSTDGTVEIAREYPVTILRIASADLTTPSAGRFVGTEAARGDYLLFVDGDMELTTGWLPRALGVVREHDDVAGVDGYLNDAEATAVEPAEMLHGVALYDAAALSAAAGFDPFLRALEDVELGFRLRDRGYRLLRLPDVVARHPRPVGAREVLRRWHNGYYFGLGQVVRKSARRPAILGRFLARYRYPLAFQGWVGAGLGAAVATATGAIGAVAVAVWLACSVCLFAADAAWEGLDEALYRVSEYALMAVGFLRGLALGSRDPDEFPLEEAVPVTAPRRVQPGEGERPADPQVTPAGGEEDADPPAHTEVEPT